MASEKWIQKVTAKMKRKGTLNAFTKYCGGKVTQECIDRAKKSNNPTLVKRATFAENMRKIKKYDEGGSVFKAIEVLDGVLNNRQVDNFNKILSNKIVSQLSDENPILDKYNKIKNKLSQKDLSKNDVDDYIKLVENIYGKVRDSLTNEERERLGSQIDAIKTVFSNDFFDESGKYVGDYKVGDQLLKQVNEHFVKFGDNPDIMKGIEDYSFLKGKFEYGGTKYAQKYEDGGSTQQSAQPQENNPSSQQSQQQTQEQTAQQSTQQQEGKPNITYDQFVGFVLQYPEYLERLIKEIQETMSQQTQQSAEAQLQPQT